MPKEPYAKIAISLPQPLLERLEERRLARGETRSEAIREAVERMLKQEQERLWEEQERAAYLAHPEVEAELMAIAEAANRSAAAAIAKELPYEWDD